MTLLYWRPFILPTRRMVLLKRVKVQLLKNIEIHWELFPLFCVYLARVPYDIDAPCLYRNHDIAALF